MMYLMYLISLLMGDEAGQPGYFVTKLGHDFTEKDCWQQMN